MARKSNDESQQRQQEPEREEQPETDVPSDVSQPEREVQQVVDQETEQGFRGVEVDGTPNENYTVQGVTSGAEVPEAAADPVQARREASQQ